MVDLCHGEAMTPPMTPREKVGPSLDELLRQAVETMKSWTPEQREAHFEAQKKAWVAAEMAFGDEGTRVITALASGSGDHSGGVTDMVDHAELARLAEEASSGPWSVDADEIGRTIVASPVEIIARDTRHNSAFIAAANPATVLALLSEIAALRSALDVCNTARLHWQEVVVPALGDRATQAERQRDELRKALERISYTPDGEDGLSLTECVNIARQALANQGADQ